VGWGHGKFDQKDLQNAHYRLNTVLDIPGGETNEEKALELEKKKEESKKRCGACGGGILGSGFEKVSRLCCVMICCNLFLLTNSPILYHLYYGSLE